MCGLVYQYCDGETLTAQACVALPSSCAAAADVCPEGASMSQVPPEGVTVCQLEAYAATPSSPVFMSCEVNAQGLAVLSKCD